MTITDIEQAIGNDRKTPLTLVLESGQQVPLNPEKYGQTNEGTRLFIPLEGERYVIIETQSVKSIIKS